MGECWSRARRAYFDYIQVVLEWAAWPHLDVVGVGDVLGARVERGHVRGEEVVPVKDDVGPLEVDVAWLGLG